MHSRMLKGALLICFTASLLVSGCGPGQILGPTLTPTPAHLSDEEFADAARDICQTLSEEYASIMETENLGSQYAGRSEAYNKAASAMAEFDITEQSAPQGTLLRTSLVRLAEAQDVFWPALSVALDKALEPGGSVSLFVLKSGEVVIVNSDAGVMETADIDPQLAIEIFNAQTAVRSAAMALGLPECAPWPEEDD